MKVEVLLSCMHQQDASIIERAHIQTDVVVVNQCNIDSVEESTFVNKNGGECRLRFICTTERGLSRSRNMAINNAQSGSICLICDDDEVLSEDYEELILQGYRENPTAEVLAFALNWNGFGKRYNNKSHKLSFKDTLGVCSVQITFKVDAIRHKQIRFDELLGSGTGNGAGEENRFMLDCRRNKLKMYYHPNVIATVNTGNSQWFNGFDSMYFENFGWSARRVFPNHLLSFLIIFYYSVKKYSLYKDSISYRKAILAMFVGYFKKKNL